VLLARRILAYFAAGAAVLLATDAGLAATCALGLLMACFIAVTTLATGLLLGAGVVDGVAGFAWAIPTLNNRVDNKTDIFMMDIPKNTGRMSLL
jgi:hypothetical protein